MVIEAVEVVYKLLVVVHSDVGLSLLYVCYLLLVARKLLLDLLDDSLVVFDLYLHVFISDALGWINGLGRPKTRLLERLAHSLLNQLQNRVHLGVHLSQLS